MRYIPFPIPVIKELYPKLNKYFGFKYDDISNELSQVYTRKIFSLTPEEKELANKCRLKDDWGGVDSVKFALETNEDIIIPVTENFNAEEILNSLTDKFDDEISFILLFMAALLDKDRINEPCFEGEYDELILSQYIHEVRPDMLKLYIALHQQKQKNGKHFIEDIKISIGGNSPIPINNKDGWFEKHLNEYLNTYLGVNNLEEAKQELDIIYGNKKKGRKIQNPIQSLYMWGTYQLLQDTFLKSSIPNFATRPQTRFIESYLRTIGLISDDDIDTDAENIRSRLNSFLKTYNTVEDLLNNKKFKFSPNNKDNLKYW